MRAASKLPLAGIPLEELLVLLEPLPSYRARQIFKWISRGVPGFDAMTDLPEALRVDLRKRFTLRSSAVSSRLDGGDGTVKLQIVLHDGLKIEAVLLSDAEGRKTACLSTQAGCPAGCLFCKTGSLGFRRNLDAGEIVEQFLHIRSAGGECHGNEKISNIVIMGMGEPLLNLAELRRALSVLTDPAGFAVSGRRITVSTSGIIEGIRELADRGPAVRLALSLTTADAGLREQLMPIASANPLHALKEALAYYQEKTGQRLTLEAVLLGGVNTRQEDMDALAVFAKGLNVVVNLIPWNPVERLCFNKIPLREPTNRELRDFIGGITGRGIKVTCRFRKGRNITGACGQLGVSEL